MQIPLGSTFRWTLPLEPTRSPLTRFSGKNLIFVYTVNAGFTGRFSTPIYAATFAHLGKRSFCYYNQTMSLVVVGSVAYDGVETPHGKVDRMLGGACTYISLAASYFTRVNIVAVVGEDFAQQDVDLLAGRNIDLAGLERVPGKTFFWAGVYSDDMNERTTLRTDLNVFADFQPKLPAAYQVAAVPAARQHPAGAAAQRARADERRAAGRRRHHELLDRRSSRGAAQDDRRMGFPADQRRRSAHALRREQSAPRGAEDPGDGAAHAGHQARRIRRDSIPARIGTSSLRATCCRMSSIRPARAIASPAGSSDIWPGRASTRATGEIPHVELRRAVIYGSVMGSFCCEKFGVDRFRTSDAFRSGCPLSGIQNLHGLLRRPRRQSAPGGMCHSRCWSAR